MTDDHGYLFILLRKLGLSEFVASTGEFLLVRPLKIALILLAALVVGRIATRAVRRFVRSLPQRAPVRSGSLRAEQRAGTVADVLASFLRAIVWGVGGLMALDEVGVNLAPLLAGAGIAGVAVGFGAQSLVRDLISGLFILVEDQYGVGDVVSLGTSTGTVEDLNLRVTRLRATDGSVWFVPNGEVRLVGNRTMPEAPAPAGPAAVPGADAWEDTLRSLAARTPFGHDALRQAAEVARRLGWGQARFAAYAVEAGDRALDIKAAMATMADALRAPTATEE